MLYFLLADGELSHSPTEKIKHGGRSFGELFQSYSTGQTDDGWI